MANVNLSDNDDHEQLINEIKRKRGDEEKLGKTLLASCVAALATFGFGYNMGFSSPVQSILDRKSNEDGMLTDEEFSLFNVS